MKSPKGQSQPNLNLKFLLLNKYGTQVEAARDLGLTEVRLSQIIHRRLKPRPEERRRIAWSLQLPAKQVFGEDGKRG